jgi:hypothetical protein
VEIHWAARRLQPEATKKSQSSQQDRAADLRGRSMNENIIFSSRGGPIPTQRQAVGITPQVTIHAGSMGRPNEFCQSMSCRRESPADTLSPLVISDVAVFEMTDRTAYPTA